MNKRCWRCGYHLDGTESYCPNCGANINMSREKFRQNSKLNFWTHVKNLLGFRSVSYSNKTSSFAKRSSSSATFNTSNLKNSLRSSIANVRELISSYNNLARFNTEYTNLILNKPTQDNYNQSQSESTDSLTDSYINMYSNNAASVLSSGIASLSNANDYLYNQYASSSASASERYENILSSSKAQSESNWDTVNEFAISYATVSLNNNKYQSSIKNETYLWDNDDRDSVANSITDMYTAKYSDNAASMVSSQTDSLDHVLSATYNKYFASSANSRVSYIASSASAANSVKASVAKSKAHDIQIQKARTCLNNAKHSYYSEYANGGGKAINFWNKSIVPNSKNIFAYKIISKNLLNKILNINRSVKHKKSVMHTLSDINKYYTKVNIYMKEVTMQSLDKIAEYQYRAYQIVKNLKNINFIKYSCLKSVDVSNNEFYRQAQLHIPSLTKRRYKRPPYLKILNKYIFNYKELCRKLHKIDHYLPDYYYIDIPKGLGEFLKRIITFKNDFNNFQKSTHGEYEVEQNLRDHNIKVISNVNLKYDYSDMQNGNNRDSNQNDIISINNNGVFIFEVKNYNHSNIWVNKYGEIAWGYKQYQHQNPYKNPICVQAYNHKQAIIYNIRRYNNKHKSWNKQIHLNPKFIHVILVYINNNKAQTCYNFHRINELDSPKNKYIDDVRNQNNCYESIDNFSKNGHIHDSTINKLKASIKFLQDKSFHHYKLVDNYEEVFRVVRYYIFHIRVLGGLYNIIFSSHFIKDKQSCNNEINNLRHKLEKYHKAQNGHWYIRRNGKKNIFFNNPWHNKRVEEKYRRDSRLLSSKIKFYNMMYKIRK